MTDRVQRLSPIGTSSQGGPSSQGVLPGQPGLTEPAAGSGALSGRIAAMSWSTVTDLSTVTRMLLVSDGSTTNLLEAMLGGELGIRVLDTAAYPGKWAAGANLAGPWGSPAWAHVRAAFAFDQCVG